MAVDPVRAVGPLPRDPILRRALEVSPTDSFFVPFPPALARWQTTSPTDYTKFLAGSQYREGGLGGPFVVLPAGVPDNAAGKGRVEALVAALAAFLHPTRVEARFVRALSPAMLRMFPTSHSDKGKQVQVEHLLDAVERNVPSDAGACLCVTWSDLCERSARSPYVVFHQHLPASPRSSRVPVGVLSVHRYTSTADPQLETLRIYKLTAAHAARMLGLDACCYWSCLLNVAGVTAHNPDRLSQFDSMPARLCPVCLRKLSVIAHSKFDVVHRYRALIKCFDGAMLGEQSVWFRERLQVITQDFGPADSHGALPVSVPSHRGELANNHSSYGTSYDSHSRRQPEQPRHRAASSTATYASGNGHGNGAPYSVHDRGYRNSLASEMLRHHAHDGASSRRDHSPERRREEPRRRSRLPEEFRSRRTSSVSPQRRRPRGSALARAGFSSVNSSNGELDTKDGGTGSGGGASGGGGGGGGTAHAGQRVHAAGAPPGMAMPAPQAARASPPAVTTGASPPSMRRSSWDGSPPHRRVQPSRLRQPKAHAPRRRVARRSDPTGDSAMRGELGGAVADSRHGPTPQLQGRHSSASLDRSKLSLLKKRMSSRRVSTRAVAQGT